MKSKFLVIAVALFTAAMLATPLIGTAMAKKGQEKWTEQWSQTYGGTVADVGYSVVQTSDGGYAIIGQTWSFGAGLNDAWLVKTDANGAVEWTQRYGDTSADFATSVIQTSDGGYAIVGCTFSYFAGGAVWLVKVDASGTLQWNKTYGTGFGYSVVQTSDGGYAIAGETSSIGAGNADAWLIKTDSSGTMQWSQTYGGADIDVGYSVVQTSDGGYAIGGHTYSFGAGDADFWLVKVDSSGKLQWDQTYGGADADKGSSVVQTSDGGYAIGGHTYSFGAGSADFWLVKVDASGTLEWSQTYGGTGGDNGQFLVETSDGGYAIAGGTEYFGAEDADAWIVKTDSSGTMQWSQTYGGIFDDIAFSVLQTIDGGFALGCTTYSFGAGNADFWLIKICAKSSASVSGTIELTSAVPVNSRPAGKSGNVILTMDLTEEWHGDIEATGTTMATWIVHNAPLMTNPDAWLNVHEKLTLSATVMGESGTLTMELSIAGSKGHWTIIGGTGGLANLRGQGTLSLETMPYSYAGQVYFSP